MSTTFDHLDLLFWRQMAKPMSFSSVSFSGALYGSRGGSTRVEHELRMAAVESAVESAVDLESTGEGCSGDVIAIAGCFSSPELAADFPDEVDPALLKDHPRSVCPCCQERTAPNNPLISIDAVDYQSCLMCLDRKYESDPVAHFIVMQWARAGKEWAP